MPRYFDRRILLFVSEDNSDALLETIKAFHLVHHRQPTEVITLSTKTGAKEIQEKVHMRADGPFFDFVREHEIGIRFDLKNIRTMTKETGTALKSLDTPENIRAGGEALISMIRDLTQDDKASLFVLLAPGCALTSAAIAGMTLFGRAQDTLATATTTPLSPLNAPVCCRDILLECLKTARLSASEEITKLSQVVKIPFRSRRKRLYAQGYEDSGRISMQWVSLQLDTSIPNRLKLPESVRSQMLFVVESRTILFNGQLLATLPPAEYATYLWLATRRSKGMPPVKRLDASVAEELLPIYQTVLCNRKGSRGTEYDHFNNLKDRLLQDAGYFAAFFTKRKAVINARLSKQLGKEASTFEIKRVGTRPFGFDLTVPAARILIP
mgnify:CR=1 FL=1